MENQPTILVVDDDADLLHLIGVRLSVAGYNVVQATSGEEAMERFHAEHPRVVITDLRMGGMDGLTLFAHLHAEAPSVPVIILTAHGTIPDAVDATQRGVFSFLTKPFDGQQLLARVAAAVAVSPSVLPAAADARWRANIISTSAAMDELLRQARRAADDDGPVLIAGPAGSGKATLARAIHDAGPRVRKPFVTVHCEALTEAEIEEQLLGAAPALHSADGGTLFIDQVVSLPAVVQAKLLTHVHGGAELFGRARSGLPNVRLIASSSIPLDRVVREGGFRGDLYYALAATTLRVPSLAERPEDIPPLVAHFIEEHGSDQCLSPEAMALVRESPWPGNVRQLKSVVEQALRQSVTPLVPASLIQRLLHDAAAQELGGFDDARRAFEHEYLEQLLRSTGGNVARAARIAQRNRTEFYKLLGRHNLDPAAFK